MAEERVIVSGSPVCRVAGVLPQERSRVKCAFPYESLRPSEHNLLPRGVEISV